MEEIKVGEVCRTRNGIIFKIDKENKNIQMNEFMNMNGNRDIVKHSPNIIDLIEDKDFVILEYKSPKYRERIKRIFEVLKIDEYISFKNVHCGFNCKVGDKKIIDNICKNVKIKSIVTHEQFQSVEYRLEE